MSRLLLASNTENEEPGFLVENLPKLKLKSEQIRFSAASVGRVGQRQSFWLCKQTFLPARQAGEKLHSLVESGKFLDKACTNISFAKSNFFDAGQREKKYFFMLKLPIFTLEKRSR
jgi:hypothetical protein